MPADPARAASDPPGSGAGLSKGATIGRYVVLGLLGRGGMGEVYAAYDPELDRKIAVKLLRAHGGEADAAADGRTRLLREAQAIARLSHPNVLVVYDVGTFKESVFIAMEYVDGHTLGYWIQASKRSWRQVLDVYMSAGRGLIAAHAAGLVHRDFKPENVMITKAGQVRVMDFGLAREQGSDAPSLANQEAIKAGLRAAALADTLDNGGDVDATAKLGTDATPAAGPVSGGYLRTKLTQTGAILGTPAYMAPEQFAGTGGDARTDQFSFCVALYEGLYGQRPFAGKNLVELMANVVGGTISEPPPDARVPTWLRRVLLRGLLPSPSDRHPSMGDLLAALGRDPAVRRRRAAAATASLLLVAGVAVGANRLSAGDRALCAGGAARAASAWDGPRRQGVERAFQASGNRDARSAFAGAAALLDGYLARWTGMYREACEATQLRGEQSAEVLDLRMGCLQDRLSSVRALTEVFAAANSDVVDNAVGAAGALPTLERCADVSMLRAVIKPPDDPGKRAQVDAARVELATVGALSSAGQCDRALALGRKVADAAKGIGYLPVQAEAHLAVGRLGETCTEPTAAVGQLEEAVWAAEASHHDEVAIVASLYLAGLYTDRNRDARLTRHWIRHGEAILARFPGHPLLQAWVAVGKAFALNGEGRFEEALPEHRRGLALKEGVLGAEHTDTAISSLNVAITLHELGRDAEAEPFIERASVVFRKMHGGDSTQLALALANQAEILTGLRRFDAARAAIEHALSIWREREAGPFYVGYGLLILGKLQLAEQRSELARASLEQAVAQLAKYPELAADAELSLARVLWSIPRDRPRALALARHARGTTQEANAPARKLAEIDAWLGEHQIR
jgi:eukaryotic-like serine/threonine-protein kinase